MFTTTINATKINMTESVEVSVRDFSDIPELTARVIRLRIMDVRIKIVSVFVFCSSSLVM
jgi:hypothetical protein